MKRSLALSLALLLPACPAATPPAGAPAAPKPKADPGPTVAPAKPAKPEISAPVVPAPAPAKQHADELARIDEEIAATKRRVEADPKGWVVRERLAGQYLGRARLSGNYDDYAKAEAAVDDAFKVAPAGAGPHLTRVALNFTLHRLDRVAADLERVAKYAIKTPTDQRALRELGAELAFQQGRYADARTGFEAALAAEPHDVTNLARLALLRWKTGDFAGAEDLYGKALGEHPGGEPEAWLHLQLGLMDLERGRYDEALAHYRDGAALIAGYWLLDEHIAEILTLQGKTDEALALYADIIARTDNPEFMDAVAGIHRAAGRNDAAAPLLARADKIYEAQLARFPEAAYGHALEHFLEFGADPKRTVTLAEANHRTRPNAEAKISLAHAYLKAGNKAAARTTIDEALATPWNTADLHATAAEVLTAVGDEAAASEQRRLALAMNPHVLD